MLNGARTCVDTTTTQQSRHLCGGMSDCNPKGIRVSAATAATPPPPFFGVADPFSVSPLLRLRHYCIGRRQLTPPTEAEGSVTSKVRGIGSEAVGG